jgi:hypothetical protein
MGEKGFKEIVEGYDDERFRNVKKAEQRKLE